jgi:hypothetical protein
MSESTNDPAAGADEADAVRTALTEALGSDDYDVVADATDRLPDGEEVRLVSAAVRGRPNQVASVAFDSAGTVRPRRELDARAGRPLFLPDLGLPAGRIAVDRPAVVIDPPSNTWTLPKCAVQKETVTVTVPPFGGPPKADVYLLADTTLSMVTVLAAVAAGSTAIVNDPSLAGYDIAWGVGNYRDFPIRAGVNSYAFQHQLSPTTNTVDATLAIGTWTAAEGSDGSEGQFHAMERIASDPAIGWRPDSRRILVWFGDAPGHDPICAAISGLGADVTEASATAALAAAGITVVAVSTTTGFLGGLDDDPTVSVFDYTGACPVGGTPGQATRIVAGAAPGGSLTTGVNAGAIVATLSALIATAVSTIGSLALVPTGAIAEFVTSVAPPSYGPLAGDVEHVLPFEVTWSGDRECGDKDQVFTGSLDVVADGVVVAGKPVTVTVPACRWHHSVEMVCGEQRPDRHEPDDDCETVVDGRYATAVTIYNPTSCPIRIEKRFAALVRQGRPVGREPDKQPARPFARIVLEPGEATMDDCCSLREVAGPTGGPLVLGVLDIVADGRLEVTAIHTARGYGDAPTGASISTRAVQPRRA